MIKCNYTAFWDNPRTCTYNLCFEQKKKKKITYIPVNPSSTKYKWGLRGLKYIGMLALCMSSVMGKPVFGFLTRSDINRDVQHQKMARGLKFWI